MELKSHLAPTPAVDSTLHWPPLFTRPFLFSKTTRIQNVQSSRIQFLVHGKCRQSWCKPSLVSVQPPCWLMCENSPEVVSAEAWKGLGLGGLWKEHEHELAPSKPAQERFLHFPQGEVGFQLRFVGSSQDSRGMRPEYYSTSFRCSLGSSL